MLDRDLHADRILAGVGMLDDQVAAGVLDVEDHGGGRIGARLLAHEADGPRRTIVMRLTRDTPGRRLCFICLLPKAVSLVAAAGASKCRPFVPVKRWVLRDTGRPLQQPSSWRRLSGFTRMPVARTLLASAIPARGFSMKQLLARCGFAACLAAALGVVPADAQQNRNYSFVIVNDADAPIDYFYFSACGANNWGGDRLGRERIDQGARRRFNMHDGDRRLLPRHARQAGDRRRRQKLGVDVCRERQWVVQ